jgi:mycothiol maleylpyruvate isomerase-like protein
MPDPQVQELLDDLKAARDEFLAAVADIDPALRTTSGLVGEWSARDLLAHVGYWAGHAGESLHRAEQGELSAFGQDELSVDERNEVVTRVARDTDFATVASREQGAYDAFVERLTALDPESLGDRNAEGDTLEEIIGFDGAGHYREHTLDIRAWFDGKDAADVDAPDEPDAD